MKKIIVMVPTAVEAAFIDASGDFSVRCCGVGMAECAAHTAKTIVEKSPDLLILAGIAGTYGGRFAVGDTVAAETETIVDLGRFADGSFQGLFQITYCATSLPEGYEAVTGCTVNCAGTTVRNPVEAGIENMEGAAFFAVCGQFGVPAMEVRTVSNRVGERIRPEDMVLSTKKLASEIGKIVAKILAG